MFVCAGSGFKGKPKKNKKEKRKDQTPEEIYSNWESGERY